MAGNVTIENMAAEIMKGLEEYADLATDEMKKCVRKAGNMTKSEIQANAPEQSGAYKKSWNVKKQSESSNTIDLIVHSKNRYQIAHLLEHGHAKRGGGRVTGKPHIAPAEEKAINEMENEITRALGG